MKRIHILKAKPRELKAGWGRPEQGETPSICYAWGAQGAEKSDARILSNAIEGTPIHNGKSLAEELESRGYDLATLKISIQMKKET